MVKFRNKMLMCVALIATLSGCGNTQQINVPNVFNEEAIDSISNNNGIKFETINNEGTLTYSDMYSQYGIDSEGNYCLRFAVAVKGAINELKFTRAGITGVDNGASIEKTVTMVYKSIIADGVVTYFDGEGLSTEPGEENYYWACYTVCYKSEESKQLYDTKINVSLCADGVDLKTKTTALSDLVNTNVERKYIFEAEASELNITSSTWGVRYGAESTGTGYSGMGYLGSYSAENNGMVFRLYSDKAATATLSLRVGLRKTVSFLVYSETENSVFSSITLNETSLTMPENMTFAASGVDPDYYCWNEQDILSLDLVEGENVITFTTNGLQINWDYIALTTTANVKWVEEKDVGHSYTDWSVTNVPTETKSGRIYRYCATCSKKEVVELPVLNDTNYSSKIIRNASEYLSEITTYTYGDYSFNVNTKEPTGTMVEKKIEGEAATINGPWTAKQLVNYSSTTVDDVTVRFAQLNNRKGDVSYKINASEDATVKMILHAAPHKNYATNYADIMRFSVNGEYIAVADNNMNAKGTSGWFDFKDMDFVTFDVKKGENTILIESTGTYSYNLDYFILKSAATLTFNPVYTALSLNTHVDQEADLKENSYFGSTSKKTFAFDFYSDKASTVRLVVNGCRSSNTYSASTLMSSLTLGEVDITDSLLTETVTFSDWYKPLPIQVADLSLVEGVNSVTFTMKVNINIYSISLVTSSGVVTLA